MHHDDSVQGLQLINRHYGLQQTLAPGSLVIIQDLQEEKGLPVVSQMRSSSTKDPLRPASQIRL